VLWSLLSVGCVLLYRTHTSDPQLNLSDCKMAKCVVIIGKGSSAYAIKGVN